MICTFEGVGLVLLVARKVLQEVAEATLLKDAHQGRAQSLIWRCRHLTVKPHPVPTTQRGSRYRRTAKKTTNIVPGLADARNTNRGRGKRLKTKT